MMDVFALNSHIGKLEAEKVALEQANEQMRREAVDHDQERRGLLNVLEEKKGSLQQSEEYLEMEVARRKVSEYQDVIQIIVLKEIAADKSCAVYRKWSRVELQSWRDWAWS